MRMRQLPSKKHQCKQSVPGTYDGFLKETYRPTATLDTMQWAASSSMPMLLKQQRDTSLPYYAHRSASKAVSQPSGNFLADISSQTQSFDQSLNAAWLCWPHQSPAAAWHAANHYYKSRPAEESSMHTYIHKWLVPPRSNARHHARGACRVQRSSISPFDCQSVSHAQCSNSQENKQQQQPSDATPHTYSCYCSKATHIIPSRHPESNSSSTCTLRFTLGDPGPKSPSESPAEAIPTAIKAPKSQAHMWMFPGSWKTKAAQVWNLGRARHHNPRSPKLTQHSSADSIRRFKCHICAVSKPTANSLPSSNPMPSRASLFKHKGWSCNAARREQPQAQHPYQPCPSCTHNTPDRTLLKQGVGKTTAQLAAWGKSCAWEAGRSLLPRQLDVLQLYNARVIQHCC